jgi:hypothetical protein
LSRTFYTELNPHLSKPIPDWNHDGFIDFRDSLIDMRRQVEARRGR